MHTLRITGHGTFLAVTGALFAAVLQCAAQVSVTTWHNDNWRTGQNTQENHFYTSGSNKLNKNNFGLLCTFATKGQVYAQPLVVAHTNDNGMDVYVADMQDYLYKFTIPGGWTGSSIFCRITRVNFRSCFAITTVGTVAEKRNVDRGISRHLYFVGQKQSRTLEQLLRHERGLIDCCLWNCSGPTVFLVPEGGQIYRMQPVVEVAGAVL